MQKRVREVFGVTSEVLPDSYVDRGSLDEELSELVNAGHGHIALRGASKCGKSWLRRKVLENPIVVQCRLNKRGIDLYADALSELEISFQIESTTSHSFKGTIKASGEAGLHLLSKIGIEASSETEKSKTQKFAPVGRDINDLRYIAEIIKASGRKLVIEDFHYLTITERKAFAFDLKALWDWQVNIVIVGVWSVDNLLLTLNPDLSGRIEELTVEWSRNDLGRILDQGGNALNYRFEDPLRSELIDASYGNAGQLQTLVLRVFQHLKITEGAPSFGVLRDREIADHAAMDYAEQLNPLYQAFARNVASGIRSRTKSTNIYAHTMAVIMNASDDELINGLSVDRIYQQAKAKESRIQLGNLKSILAKIESLQVDEDGRGLVLSYNEHRGVSVVDRQLLLYRKYATVDWPWEEIIAGSGTDPSLDADDAL